MYRMIALSPLLLLAACTVRPESQNEASTIEQTNEDRLATLEATVGQLIEENNRMDSRISQLEMALNR